MSNNYNRKDEARIKYFENKRINALGVRDASGYTELCDVLGLEPEDKHLYEQGQAEKIYMNKLKNMKTCDTCETKIPGFSEYLLFHNKKRRHFCRKECLDDFVIQK